MRRLPICWLCLLAFVGGCQESPGEAADEASQSRAETRGAASAKWNETAPLPRLAARQMLPIRDRDQFRIENTSIKYPRDEVVPEPPRDAPFGSQEEAVAAAKEWIRTHFGPLQVGATLEVNGVQNSASGRDKPAYDWDVGHTISFGVDFRGIPTDSAAVVYIIGRSRFSGTFDLHTYEAVADSQQPIVSREAAVAAWKEELPKAGAPPETIEQFSKLAKPVLKFVWYPPANVPDRDEGFDIFAPTWVVDEDRQMMVDGHSGKTWHND